MTARKKKTSRYMSEKNADALVKSIKQMGDYMRGKKVSGVRVTTRARAVEAKQVKQVRQSLGWTQDQLGRVVGEGVAAVQSGEQGVRRPSGAASKLIRALEEHPELAPDFLKF